MNPVSCLLGFSLLASASFAGTITVGPMGSGANFNSLSPAVASAVAGDTILISPGSYPEANVMVIDKPLTIIGSGSAVTELVLPGYTIWSPLTIEQSAPGEMTQLSGLSISLIGSGYPDAPSISIEDCLGPVHLQDIVGVPSSGPGRGVSLRAEASAMVLLESCDFFGSSNEGNCGTPAPNGVPAMEAVTSTLFLSRCTLSAGPVLDKCFVQPGFAALHLENATVHVGDSWLQGSLGKANLSGWTLGHPAVELTGISALSLFGATSLEGGGGGLVPAPFGDSYGGAAIELLPDQTITATPEVTFTAGKDWDGATTANPINDYGGTLTMASERWATLASGTQPVALGGSVTLTMGGEPGSLVMPYLAFGLGNAPLSVPGVDGVILIELIGAKALPIRTLDAMGADSMSFPVPPIPALVGASYPVQSLALHPGGAFSLSSMATITLL